MGPGDFYKRELGVNIKSYIFKSHTYISEMNDILMVSVAQKNLRKK